MSSLAAGSLQPARYSMRDAFGRALVELGKVNDDVVVLDADVAHPTRSQHFGEEFPERFFQIGVAEANMIGVAAGLATLGYIPFAVTFAAFVSRRACDQVALSVAYPRLNVKIVGAYAGLSSYSTGATHQSLGDLAIMRSMPNMVVVEPADALQLERLMVQIALYDGPVYLRLVRDDLPLVCPDGESLSLGRGITLRHGKDVTLVGSGSTVCSCLEAARALVSNGIDARVLGIHTIKPIDKELVLLAAAETKAVVTVENHSVIGGLGSAVADVLAEACLAPMRMIGVKDRFGTCGMPSDLIEEYGLTPARVVEAVEQALGLRGND